MDIQILDTENGWEYRCRCGRRNRVPEGVTEWNCSDCRREQTYDKQEAASDELTEAETGLAAPSGAPEEGA